MVSALRKRDGRSSLSVLLSICVSVSIPLSLSFHLPPRPSSGFEPRIAITKARHASHQPENVVVTRSTAGYTVDWTLCQSLQEEQNRREQNRRKGWQGDYSSDKDGRVGQGSEEEKKRRDERDAMQWCGLQAVILPCWLLALGTGTDV